MRERKAANNRSEWDLGGKSRLGVYLEADRVRRARNLPVHEETETRKVRRLP